MLHGGEALGSSPGVSAAAASPPVIVDAREVIEARNRTETLAPGEVSDTLSVAASHISLGSDHATAGTPQNGNEHAPKPPRGACNRNRRRISRPDRQRTASQTTSTCRQAPRNTEPRSGVQRTTAPRSNATRSNAPRSNAQRSNAPRSNTPRSNEPRRNVPRINAPSTNAQRTNAPRQHAQRANGLCNSTQRCNLSCSHAQRTNAQRTNAQRTNAQRTNTQRQRSRGLTSVQDRLRRYNGTNNNTNNNINNNMNNNYNRNQLAGVRRTAASVRHRRNALTFRQQPHQQARQSRGLRYSRPQHEQPLPSRFLQQAIQSLSALQSCFAPQ